MLFIVRDVENLRNIVEYQREIYLHLVVMGL